MIPIRCSSVRYFSFYCIFYSFIFNRLCHPSFRTSTSRQLLATLTIRFVFKKKEKDIAFTSLFKGMFWFGRRDGTHRWSPFHPPGPQDPQFQWWVKTSPWASWDLPRIQIQCHGLPSLFHLLWPGNILITHGFVSHKSFNPCDHFSFLLCSQPQSSVWPSRRPWWCSSPWSSSPTRCARSGWPSPSCPSRSGCWASWHSGASILTPSQWSILSCALGKWPVIGNTPTKYTIYSFSSKTDSKWHLSIKVQIGLKV